MLAGDFYTLEQVQQAAEGMLAYSIKWNAGHAIFGGHFPEQPVVPGVCMMQTIQELLENALQRKVLLKKAVNMKFLTMIDPRVHPQVQVTLQYAVQESEIKVSAVIKQEALTFMKFQGVFV